MSDNESISDICFNETLAIINEKRQEVGEFIGKIRTCNNSNDSASIIINLHSTSFSEHGKETGMSLVTNTTIDFNSYEEKWSQWLVPIYL